jgi:hypothetical protein
MTRALGYYGTWAIMLWALFTYLPNTARAIVTFFVVFFTTAWDILVHYGVFLNSVFHFTSWS